MFTSLFRALGLSGDPKPTPQDVGPVHRRMFFRDLSPDQVSAALDSYQKMNAKGADHTVRVAGPLDGWVAVELPEVFHAYYFHNLLAWIAAPPEGPKAAAAVGTSAAPAEGFTYWVGPHPDFDDSLVGGRPDAERFEVYLPNNAVFAGQGAPTQSVDAALDDLGVPPQLREPALQGEDVPFSAYVLGAQMDPLLVPKDMTLAAYRGIHQSRF